MSDKLTELHEDIFRGGKIAGVDKERGILRGVKLCGVKSANGHSYSDRALDDCARLYEGTMVNIDHPGNRPGAPRSVRDRFGKVQNAKSIHGEGVTGDVVYNPVHPLAESIGWFAENMPEAIGFSHNGAGKVVNTKVGVTVESVAVVRHVDLVADPASTKTLFESMSALHSVEVDLEDPEEPDMSLKDLKLAQLQEERPDIVNKILEESKVHAESKKQLTTLQEENKTLKEKVDGFEVKEALGTKKEKVAKILKESKLPKEAITETFQQTLLEAKDEDAMKALVEDRQKLVLSQKPKSRETKLVEGKDAKLASMTSEDFVSQLKGG